MGGRLHPKRDVGLVEVGMKQRKILRAAKCGSITCEQIEAAVKAAKRERLHKAKVRAGKRKCARCKEVWNRAKGDTNTVCPRCQIHCKRCDVLFLTVENRKVCRKCTAEMVQNTKTGLSQRDSNLVRTYGITVNEYEVMLETQGGVCWICEKPQKNRRLSVDHKHEKGEKRRSPRLRRSRVRGLLCWRCNTALGKFDDNPTFLRKAADYLEATPAQEVLSK